jgi:DNA polymerase/3'-5' exonuclease PolX
MDVDGNDFTDDSYTIAMLASVATLTAANEEAYNEYTKYTQNLENAQAEYDSIQERLADIATATKEVEKEFYTKYSRYIQEGSWIDDNYMDDDLYYLDALSVLYQSAYPKVTYSFTPLDLKYLEGYEDFDF